MRTRRIVVSFLAALLTIPLLAGPTAAAGASTEPTASSADPTVEKVKAERVLPKSKPRLITGPSKSTAGPVPAPAAREGTAVAVENVAGSVDPVAQFSTDATRDLGELGAPLIQWDGMAGSNPNDTTGDVGPDHFVQAINSRVTVYDKAGNVVAGPRNLGQFWDDNDGVTDACEGNAGDPVVLYDNLADRWMIAQFSRFAPFTTQVCMAVSVTASPDWANGYYAYVFDVGMFPDYLKFGAWHDGYYMSANGAGVAIVSVFDRSNMLNGNPAGAVLFPGVADLPGNNFNVLMPSDIDGSSAPPAGSPGYFYRPVDGDAMGGGADRVELFEATVNWGNPAASTLAGPTNINLAAFDMAVCGFLSFGCIPQPGASGILDPVNETGMFRFPYRNYGSREVLAGNFTVDTNGADGAGIRWFVLERTGGAWSVDDQGTFAPQPTGAPQFVHRFMGSLALDRFGNLALGYTRSSADHPSATVTGFASAVYTGRSPSDPPGLLPKPEMTIEPGTGAIGASGALTRWGDYYTMVVDPVDDCTFWYTGDYATTQRQSVIASFRFADCATDLEIGKTISPSQPTAGGEATYTITVENDGPIPAQNVIVTDQLPAEATYLADTDTCSGVAVGATGTLTCSLGDLAAGASTSFQVKVRIDPDLGGVTSITNVASVSSDADESDPSDNTVSLTTLVSELADLSVTKLCKPDSNPAQAGTNGTCTILVTNNGPSAARSVTLTDTHASNGSFTITSATASQGSCVIAHPTVTCDLGTIGPAETVSVEVVITSPDGIDVNDVARVTSPTPDPNTANNEAHAGLSFSASADLSITKSGPTSVNLDDTFSYTLTVDNAGPSTATNVVVTDTLPGGVEIVSTSASVGSVTAIGGVITWNLGNVAPADPPRTLEITVHVLPSAPATLVNNATVTSSTADPDTANNQATWSTTVVGTDLWIDKQGIVSAQNPAGALIYRITVHNEPGSAPDDTPTSGHGGPNAATNVVVSDPLPLDSKKLIVQFLSPGCVYDKPSHTVTCTTASLPAGTSVTYEIQVQIKGSVGSITNVATVTSATFDPNLANNSDTVNNVIQGSTGKGPKPK